jgi:hypothetical protein
MGLAGVSARPEMDEQKIMKSSGRSWPIFWCCSTFLGLLAAGVSFTSQILILDQYVAKYHSHLDHPFVGRELL